MGLIVPPITVSSGNGSLSYLPILNNNTPDRAQAASPNASWALTSPYNRPNAYVSASDFYARSTASAQMQEEIRRRAREQAARLAAEGRLFDKPEAAISAVDQAKMDAAIAAEESPLQKVTNWINQFNVAPGATGDLTPEQRVAADRRAERALFPPPPQGPGLLNPTKGPERTGFRQVPSYDANGNIAGYKYVSMTAIVTPKPAATPATSQNAPSTIDYLTVGSRGKVDTYTLYDEISALEISYEARERGAAIEAWGMPINVVNEYNPNAPPQEDWASYGKSFLGLDPGEIVAPRPPRPDETAPHSEWVKYRDRLQASIKLPIYTPESVRDEFNAIGTTGIRQFQKDMVAAGLYPEGERYVPGIVREIELDLMFSLMEAGNLSGLTYQNVIDLYKTESKQQAAASAGYGGGGGGGGGGGETTYTQTQYTQTSIAQARSLMVDVLTKALGRAPTNNEIVKFVQMLNKAEMKSPTTTVTKTSTGEGSTSAVSTTTPTSVDAEYLATEFAKGVEGGAAYEGVATDRYLNALFQSLGSASV